MPGNHTGQTEQQDQRKKCRPRAEQENRLKMRYADLTALPEHGQDPVPQQEGYKRSSEGGSGILISLGKGICHREIVRFCQCQCFRGNRASEARQTEIGSKQEYPHQPG